jgi:hypothetical protein
VTAAAVAGLDAAAEAYVAELTARLEEALDGLLLGAWLLGSGARDDYVPGRSDLDVAAAVSRVLSHGEKEAVVARCRHDALPCPAKGLELVVHTPERAPAYELNLNGGPVVPFRVSYEAGEDEPWWFAVDLAAARDAARPLAGPPLADVFAPLDPALVRKSVLAVLGWQERHELHAANSVLNACRAWRFAVEGDWASKSDSAAWARDADPELVDAALELRRTGEGSLDPERVRALIERTREALS